MDENGQIKNEGDIIIDEKFAATLERIANDPSKDTFYSGELADDIELDLKGSFLRIIQ